MNTTRIRERIFEGVVFIQNALIFLVLFRRFIFDQGKILLDLGFDGFKNYFTFAYYVRHGAGGHFGGMAYPYGDKIVFADAQPSISIPLHYLSRLFPVINDYTFLLINVLMGLGIALGSLFIYKIFRFYKLPVFFSMVLATGIAFLSPQLYRMSLHHSLAYVFVVPSIIWIHIWATKTISNFRVICFSLWLLFITFIHSYYLLMFGLYFFGYYLMDYIGSRRWNIKMYLALLFPFLTFFIYMMFDPFTGRPEAPWGLFVFKANVHDLFFPFAGISKEIWKSLIPSLNLKYSEGSAYLGIVGVIGFILLIVDSARSRFQKSNISNLSLPVISSIPILLFALQIPFIWLGEDIVSQIPIIGQFRGSGRFIWVCYYIFSIYGLIYFYRRVQEIDQQGIRVSLFIVMLATPIFEAYFQITPLIKEMNNYAGSNVFTEHRWISNELEVNEVPLADVKAVITIPPSTIGSEKLDLYDDFAVKLQVWPFSWQTGIPSTSINLSRTSLHHVCQIMALTCNEYVPISNPKLLPKGKYIIVIKKELQEYYSYLLSKAEYLGQNRELKAFLINRDSLLDRKPGGLNGYLDNKLLPKDNVVFYNDFNIGSVKGVSGNAVRFQKCNEIFSIDVDSLLDSKLDVSIWSSIDASAGGILEWNISEFNRSGKLVERYSFRENTITKFEVYENWINFNRTLDLNDSTRLLKINLKGKNLTLDEFIVKSLR